MKFKIVLKTKNEDELIDLWIRYYLKMVGKENLAVFDDGSDSERVLQTYRDHGIETLSPGNPENVHFYYHNREFYEEVFSNYDWFSVLDTDEFLCVYKDGIFSADVPALLENSSDQAVGSFFLFQMNVGDSVEYFKQSNPKEHSKAAGKCIYRTSCPNLREIPFGHNKFCNEARLDSGLVCLHLCRTNPERRIKNCIDMAISKPSQVVDEGIKEELRNLKITGKLSKKLFETKVDYHKLKEIKHYYTDRYSYIKTHYGTEPQYIRTNVINHFIHGEEYRQEIVSADPDFLGMKS